MTIVTTQWPVRFDGLVKARDLKIEMANKAGLSAEKTAEFVARAHNEFHASIADEMKRRADHSADAGTMIDRDPIVTSYDPPPIPVRNCDWSAVRNSYEPPMPIGYGATEADAIEDLIGQEDDATDALVEAVRD